MVIKTSPINFVLKNGWRASWVRTGRFMEVWVPFVHNYTPPAESLLPAGYKATPNLYEAYPEEAGTLYKIEIEGWVGYTPLDSPACPTAQNPIAGNGSAASSSRQEANKAILNLISKMVIKYPDLRFGQIMELIKLVSFNLDDDSSLSWKDEHYLESVDLLDRVIAAYKERTEE